ncbi:MAG TPA: LPS export ABC transporter periplasmic protein LptC [Gammaproteobacteria bacterium]|nr:LPS export ABC transporter periplasmic protein LptC [Gammaproteobacteria bacterium]
MNLRNAAGIVLLVAAAGASYWWSRPPPAAPATQGGDGAELPGYYMKGAGIIGTDEQGRVALQIHADSLAEVPGEERLAFDGVRIDYTPAHEAPWSISASHATAPRDTSHFDFEGDVDLRSVPTDGSKPWQVLTAAMHFQPHESQVTTEGEVEIRIGDWRFTGVRLRALLNAKKLELESVHGLLSH